MGVLIYLVAIWGALFVYQEYLQPRWSRQRRRLKLQIGLWRDRQRWDRDRLSAPQSELLLALATEAEDLHRQRVPVEDIQKFLSKAQGRLNAAKLTMTSPWPREVLELVVVVFGVVMGIRGLFFQPFKIPTGSMQPTLYGIHFTHQEAPPPRGLLRDISDNLNFGARAADVVAPADGDLNLPTDASAQHPGPWNFFFPTTDVAVAGKTYGLPGEWGKVRSYVDEGYYQRHPRVQYPSLARGDVVARGYLETGDHLFVDRVWYNFAEPRRGDIVVFVTTGLTVNGDPLNGLFYIKRLVGLPGETLKIEDRKVFVQQADGTWQVLDGTVHRAFARMATFQGGYRGYLLPPADGRAPFLNADRNPVTLGPDQYLMLGDNSENSLDGRYFGPVPRGNIIGCARFVWWPFTRRWGLADHVGPVAVPTPPQRPDGKPSAKRPAAGLLDDLGLEGQL